MCQSFQILTVKEAFDTDAVWQLNISQQLWGVPQFNIEKWRVDFQNMFQVQYYLAALLEHCVIFI